MKEKIVIAFIISSIVFIATLYKIFSFIFSYMWWANRIDDNVYILIFILSLIVNFLIFVCNPKDNFDYIRENTANDFSYSLFGMVILINVPISLIGIALFISIYYF